MDQEPTLKAVLADIKKGKIAPCYLLYGDEEYLVKKAFQEIAASILPEGGDLNLVVIDGEHEDDGRLAEALLTPSLISGKKLIVLRDTRLLYSRQTLPELVRKIKETLESNPSRAVKIFGAFLKTAGWTLEDLGDGNWKKISDEEWSRMTGDDDREKWLPKLLTLYEEQGLTDGSLSDGEDAVSSALLAGLPDENCLILTAGPVDKRKKLFKIIAETGVVLGFNRAKGEARQKDQMMEAAKEFLRKKRKDISPEALLALGRKAGFDLRKSAAELEKLVTFVEDKPRIDEQDVENIIGKTREDSIFDLTGALGEKDLGKALAILRSLLDQGVHYLVILAMVIREMRFLLHAKMLLASGILPPFNSRTEYGRFQKAILPPLKEWSAAGNRLELAGQHPFVIYNALKFSERYSKEELIGHLEFLRDLDLALKTTGQDPLLAMERLVIRLCSQGANG